MQLCTVFQCASKTKLFCSGNTYISRGKKSIPRELARNRSPLVLKKHLMNSSLQQNMKPLSCVLGTSSTLQLMCSWTKSRFQQEAKLKSLANILNYENILLNNWIKLLQLLLLFYAFRSDKSGIKAVPIKSSSIIVRFLLLRYPFVQVETNQHRKQHSYKIRNSN